LIATNLSARPEHGNLSLADYMSLWGMPTYLFTHSGQVVPNLKYLTNVRNGMVDGSPKQPKTVM
jgi:hypothetical protein